MIVRFPQERCSPPSSRLEPCVVLVFPVVKVERDPVLVAFDAMAESFRAWDEALFGPRREG